MKKLIALLLAAVMLLAMAACGSTASSAPTADSGETALAQETSAQEAPAEEAPTEAAPIEEAPSEEASAEEASAGETPAEETPAAAGIVYPVAEPVTLTALGGIYQPRTADKITSWSESLPYTEAAEATGITIDMTCVASNQLQEQTQLTISAGDYPDLFSSLNMYYQVQDLIDQDIIIDLAPYLDEYAPDYMAAVREMGYEKDIVTDSGASPATYYINEGTPNSGMMIRKDLLDKAGLDIPVTYDDYDVVMAAFKDMGVEEPWAMDGSSAGGSDVYNAALGVQLYSHPIQGSGNDGFYQVDGKIKYGFLEEGFVTYVTQMADWFSKGYINPDYVTANENNNAEEFTARVFNGTIGAVTAGRTNIDTYNTEGQAINPDFLIVPIPSPRLEAGQEIHLAPWRQSSLNAGFFASSACENIEALLAWHNYWFTEEGNMLTNYGVEGLTYNMEGGKPVFTDYITNNPEGMTLTQTTYIYVGQMGVVDNSREDQWYSEATVEAKTIWGENVDNDWKIPGACTMSTEESEDYGTKFSDISTYVKEMFPKFIMGDEPIENIGAFQEQLYAMGIEDCMADWQGALDRYNQR